MFGRFFITLIFFSFVTLFTFLYFKDKNLLPKTDNQVEQIQEQKAEEEIISLSEKNQSKEYGKASIRERGSEIMILIEMKGFPESVVQPAFVYKGSCEILGEIKYKLNPVIDGKSETFVSISFEDLKKELPLAINIHKAPTEMNTSSSCGDLTF